MAKTIKDNTIQEAGNRYGKWTVLERSSEPRSENCGRVRWLCRCDCGTIRNQDGNRLRQGKTTSCGCAPRKPHPGKLSPEEVERRNTQPRQCSKCLKILPPEYFYYDRPTWHWCKPCRSIWAKSRPKIPHLWLKKRYDLTYEEYLSKLASQDGKCCICGTPWTKENPLHVDHDHILPSKDKRSHRGLLCRDCNTTIGHMRGNLENMQRAVGYLRFHKKRLDILLKCDSSDVVAPEALSRAD